MTTTTIVALVLFASTAACGTSARDVDGGADATADGADAMVDGAGADATGSACTVPDGGAPNEPGQIDCGGVTCHFPSEVCCVDSSGNPPWTGTCLSATQYCGGSQHHRFECKQSADCPNGQVCCSFSEMDIGFETRCVTTCAAPAVCRCNEECKGFDKCSPDGFTGFGFQSGFCPAYGNNTFPGTFDLTTVSATAKGYAGGTFDGHHLYLAPFFNGSGAHGLVARYDGVTWSTFDTTTLSSSAAGFQGAVFDGRYVYFVPNQNSTGRDGLVTRYDTTADFGATSSWSTFDTTAVTSNAKGFEGATFDGRYVYFVPNGNPSADGLVVRYDTTANFSSVASWSTFDTSTVNVNAKGFAGAVFDGHYVYFVPSFDGVVARGVVTRYDTTANFALSSSWSTFDTTTVSSSAKGFVGGAFDGRYVYFVPLNNGAAYDGVVARYDTTVSFTATSSWSNFDTTTVDTSAKGFAGAAFDGRYVYLVPYNNGVPDGIITRYDTSASFVAASSWSTSDTTTANANAKGFFGAVFTGSDLYLVPNDGSIVTFSFVKQPPHIPSLPQFSGSFF